ncbi:hypothetical protein [Citreimonas salinaria]|uniref:Uncharacterized protein n=1 Tax=Citreimonas salinaria TaxID=321339 RepID=A0A1H3IQL6_9RHOB|nr:hypothetical protein [Citreimonas salinaria]SDY29897.1 hypothetical protein SAMN05444340_105208 [Citreimonas salinaria]
MRKDKELIQAYGRMIMERAAEGWACHQLAFMFNQLSGSRSAKVKQMQEEVERTYAKILSHVYRHPKKKPLDDLPLWIGAPDLHVFKNQKSTHVDCNINDGLHFQVIVAFPPWTTRLKSSLSEYISLHQERFVGPTRYLSRLHASDLAETQDYAAEYVLKTIKKLDFGSDDILVLPKSSSEMSRLTNWERRQVKREGALRRLKPAG